MEITHGIATKDTHRGPLAEYSNLVLDRGMGHDYAVNYPVLAFVEWINRAFARGCMISLLLFLSP
jgi:hypothetical protein